MTYPPQQQFQDDIEAYIDDRLGDIYNIVDEVENNVSEKDFELFKKELRENI